MTKKGKESREKRLEKFRGEGGGAKWGGEFDVFVRSSWWRIRIFSSIAFALLHGNEVANPSKYKSGIKRALVILG